VQPKHIDSRVASQQEPDSDIDRRSVMAKQQHQKKQKTGEPPPVDKLIRPAIGIGLALLAWQFMKGLGSEIPRANWEDELELRELFFGENLGKSYAVLCHSETANVPVSSVFQDAYADGGSPAEFRLLDCDAVLPSSGKSVAERFNLNVKQRPTVFVSGKVGPPKQVPTKHLKTGAMLVKLLKNMLEPHAAKIETTQDLRSKCLGKDVCGLLLKGSKTAPAYLKDAVAKLLVEFPNVAFASVDATVLYVLNLEEHMPELAFEQPRFAVFKKVSGSLEVGGERLITSFAALPENGVSYLKMSNLVGDVVSGKQTTTKLASLPVIKTRTKKLEEQERAKRQRKQQREQSGGTGSGGGGTGGGGAFEANDGTKEGRRLERERRRAEHNAQHNVKERTPEEIAEIERRRRERMAEEAAKWNIAPDDAPPEGEPVGDHIDMEDMYEDEDGGSGEYYTEEEDEEDDEDVIDLD